MTFAFIDDVNSIRVGDTHTALSDAAEEMHLSWDCSKV